MIEVLVAMLLLSIGMLSLNAILGFSIQLPKLAAYRATATNLASSYIERISANSSGFKQNSYQQDISYTNDAAMFDLKNIIGSQCNYPCTPTELATMDFIQMKQAVRAALPGGGLLMQKNTDTSGIIWIIWNQPDSISTPINVDQCPAEVASYASPKPHCIAIPFNL